MTPVRSKHARRVFARGEVHRLRGWQLLVGVPAALGVYLYQRSWRLRISAAERALLASSDRPLIIVTTHNRSFVITEVLRRHRDLSRLATLISPSRAAAWEAAYFRRLGFAVIRGSSTRGGLAALREMLRAFRQGYDLGLSPDGPTGPCYAFKPGVAALARHTGAPVLLVTVNARWAVRLRTWDRHLIPGPFARLEVRVERIDDADTRAQESGDAGLAALLRGRMLAMTRDGDESNR